MITQIWFLVVCLFFSSRSEAFTSSHRHPLVLLHQQHRHVGTVAAASPSENNNDAATRTTSSPPPPVLNGKRVLPYRIMVAGIKGQTQLAAVYAILDASYKRGQEGWEAAVHVGVSQDLATTLESLVEKHGAEKVANIRALSFSFPQPGAMQDVAGQWKEMALDAGASLDPSWEATTADVLNYLYDDDDDDDDDEFEDRPVGAGGTATNGDDTVVSPFDEASDNDASTSSTPLSTPTVSAVDEPLEFTAENVDKVLDEVRPYLISDGGNVVVDRVDEETRSVYLLLEGACGSCPSSTVTMQMGIERTLRENFENLGEVIDIPPEDSASAPKELTWEAVEEEVSRLRAAVSAMGGVVRLLDIDTETGVVKLLFRGPAKVQQGLELALLDLPFVNRVECVMDDD